MKDAYYVDEGGILSYPDGRPMSPADASAKINRLVQDITLGIGTGSRSILVVQISATRHARNLTNGSVSTLSQSVTRLRQLENTWTCVGK